MIDRTATAEQIGDALVAGDVSRNRDGVQFLRNSIEAVDVAGGNDNVGPLPLGEFGSREAYAGRAPNDNDFLPASVM